MIGERVKVGTEIADEVEAITEEMGIFQLPGYLRRKQWILSMLEEEGEKLMLGQVTDDRERHQAEGRCQAYKCILDRDKIIAQAWTDLKQETQSSAQPEELEGGDYGINYEASR